MKEIELKILSLLFYLMTPLFLSACNMSAKSEEGEMIWKGETHAAFTSLIHYKGHFYCAFRNANKHYDPTGKDCGSIKIIRSRDAKKWEEYLCISEPDFDLRDPQLSVTPSDELMLLTEKVKYNGGKPQKRNTCVSFIKKRGTITELKPIEFSESQDYNWIWNVEWVDGVAYGFNYTPFFGFVKSEDGINYELIARLNLEDLPTEASIVKMSKKELFAVVRTKSKALLGIYNIKKGEWKWKKCTERVDCPKIIVVKNDIYVVGRSYEGGRGITLYKYDKGKQNLESCVRITGGKDCAYPGIVYFKGHFFISYYRGNGGESDIYLYTLSYL